MKYLLEFTREVVTHDGYSVEVDVDSPAAARELAERMAGEMDHNCPDEAAETGPVECDLWTVKGVTAVTTGPATGGGLPMPANDTASGEPSSTLTLPKDVWEGLLRAAQIGAPVLGVDDRAAVAGFTALKLHVHLEDVKVAAAG